MSQKNPSPLPPSPPPAPPLHSLAKADSLTHPFLPYRNSEREKGLFMEGEQRTTAYPRCVPPNHVLYLLLHYARTDRLHTFYKGGGDTLFVLKKFALPDVGKSGDIHFSLTRVSKLPMTMYFFSTCNIIAGVPRSLSPWGADMAAI